MMLATILVQAVLGTIGIGCVVILAVGMREILRTGGGL